LELVVVVVMMMMVDWGRGRRVAQLVDDVEFK
jgi:hypothetical protein